MVTEDYVSFETAKLLKEKGFNQDYYNYPVYWMNGKKPTLSFEGDDDFPYSQNECVAPTLASVMKWLREVHIIHVDIIIEGNGSCIKYYSNIRPFKIIYPTRFGDSIDTIKIGTYNTYEEACKAAIKYCLTNLI